MRNLALVIFVVFSIGCKKTQENINSGIDTQSYKEITINSMNGFLARNSESPNFPTVNEVLNHDSYILEFLGSGQIDSVFLTPIYRDDELASSIIGFVADNSRLLNIVTIPTTDGNQTIVDVFYIDRTHLGSYTIESDHVVDVEIFGDPEVVLTAADLARSWWGCTKECVKDAHIACYEDSHCMSMLFISNFNWPATRAAGLGSASIGIACGAVCIKNRQTDLLPGN